MINDTLKYWRAPAQKTPFWVKFIGGLYCDGKGSSIRTRWGEFVPKFGLALSLDKFGDPAHWSLHIHFFWPGVYVRLPGLPKKPPREIMESWGFSLFSKDLHLKWGDRYRIIPWPFRRTRWQTFDLCEDGNWRERVYRKSEMEERGETERVAVWQYPFRYLTRGGEFQETTATVTIEKSVGRMRKWLPWPARTTHGIKIDFAHEMGSERGSWKGGVIGTSCTMLPDETPLMTLRRFERNADFCR